MQDKILVVDDQPDNLAALCSILRNYHTVVEATSNEDAKNLLNQDTFAVILLDVQMQNFDSFAFAKWIRGQNDTPIIFLTAVESNRLPLEQEVYALGAVDYIIKPLVPFSLQAKVAWFVKSFHQKQQTEERLVQALTRLQEQREWLKVTLGSIGDAVIAVDLADRVTFLNFAARELTGWSQHDAEGQKLEAIFPVHDIETGKLIDLPLKKVAKEGVAVDVGDNIILTTKNGVERNIEDSVSPIKDSQGHITGLLLIFRDVTQRKSIIKQLQEKTKVLEEMDKQRNEFLAMLGHELRNPLTPIVNAVTVLKSQTSFDVCDIIERQTQQLIRIVDDLLDMARIISGRIDIRKELVTLNDIVDRSVETVEPLVAKNEHQLSVSIPRDNVWVNVDLTRIQQVLVNVLTNACKYTPNKGLIQLTAHTDAHEVTISVKDSGIGIATNMLHQVFELFRQAERSLARSEGGLGIGLTMAQNLIAMHGGSIAVKSEGLDKGSEFIIKLPFVKIDRLKKPSLLPQRQVTKQPLRILVVDDNRDVAQSLAMLLKSYGHEVEVVYDGLTAVDTILEKNPFAVLLDIGLTKLTGYEVAQKVRAVNKDVHLIAVTGYSLESDKLKAKEAGIDHYLIKPVEPKQLYEILEKLAS